MEKDIKEKRLESYKDVFVDIINNIVCDGRQVLKLLYFGRKWSGPKRLHDMLEFPAEAENILRKLVPDYPLILVEVGAWLKQTGVKVTK